MCIKPAVSTLHYNYAVTLLTCEHLIISSTYCQQCGWHVFRGMTYFEFFSLNADGNGKQHGVCWRPAVLMTLVRQVKHAAARVTVPSGSGGRALSHAGCASSTTWGWQLVWRLSAPLGHRPSWSWTQVEILLSVPENSRTLYRIQILLLPSPCAPHKILYMASLNGVVFMQGRGEKT